MIFAGGYNGYSAGQTTFYSESFLNFEHFTTILQSKVPTGTPIFVSGTIKTLRPRGQEPYIVLGIRESITDFIGDLLSMTDYGYNLGETASGDLVVTATMSNSRMSVRLRVLTQEGAEAYRKIKETDLAVPPNSIIRRMGNVKRTKPLKIIAEQREEHIKVMERCFAVAEKYGSETLNHYRKEMGI